MTPGACAAITACGNAPNGWARVSAGDTSPGVAKVPRTAAPATASYKKKKKKSTNSASRSRVMGMFN